MNTYIYYIIIIIIIHNLFIKLLKKLRNGNN